MIDCRNGPARVVEEADLGIDAEHAVERGMDVAGAERFVLGGFAEAVRAADEAATFHAAAAEEAEHRVSPVVAARCALAHRGPAVAAVVHPGSAAEFAAE